MTIPHHARRLPLYAFAMAAALAASPVLAQPLPGETALTIYSTARPGAIPPEIYQPSMQPDWSGRNYAQVIPGFAIVKQERPIELPNRRMKIRFVDVAAQIDPTTVRFESITDPEGTTVLDQNFEFDLVSTEKLMERYIDKMITVEQSLGDQITTFTGVLLSTRGGLVLRNEDGQVLVINGYSNVQFPDLPGGLITRPTLVWDLVTNRIGTHRTRVTYETKAITWWADYNIVFAPGENANRGLLDVGAWVSIINQSGATYDEAKLKLIAGDVHRAQPQRSPMAMARKAMAYEEADAAGFEEKAFFEYHLYTLGRPATLPDNSTKQIELFPAALQVPAEKVLVYNGIGEGFPYYGSPMTDRNFGVQSNQKVNVYLRFKNSEEVGLGMPLPSGRIRVSQRDPADDTLEFIGEDTIDHTPKNEEVLIRLGNAFDVVGERRQVNFEVDTRRQVMTETVAIKVRNHKEESVDVIIKESLYRWTGWDIVESSDEYEKIDSRTIHFPVTIKPGAEAEVVYTVRYTW